MSAICLVSVSAKHIALPHVHLVLWLPKELLCNIIVHSKVMQEIVSSSLAYGFIVSSFLFNTLNAVVVVGGE